MSTKAFLLVRSAAAADHSRNAEWIRDMEAVPEVQHVHRVLGRHDLLVTVQTSAHVLRVADRIAANGCVDHLVVRFGPIAPALALAGAGARL